MEFDSAVALLSLAVIAIEKVKLSIASCCMMSPCMILQVEGHPGWPTGFFYCLGSHSGRTVVAAALLGHFQAAVGIESCGALHHIALEVASILP